MKRIFLILTAVLMLCLAACGGVSEDETPPSERDDKYDLIPMVMVDGELYYDTGRESSIKDRRCGTMDGEITSTVEVGRYLKRIVSPISARDMDISMGQRTP